jgi:hypothetical protein
VNLGRFFLLLTLSLILFGCTVENTEVDFLTDLYILRGTWLGSSDNSTTSSILNLASTYVSKNKYTVIGTIQFGNDSPLNISGTVYAFRVDYNQLQAQTTITPESETFVADILDANNVVIRQFCTTLQRDGKTDGFTEVYSGLIGPPNSFEVQNDSIKSCYSQTIKEPFILRKSN